MVENKNIQSWMKYWYYKTIENIERGETSAVEATDAITLKIKNFISNCVYVIFSLKKCIVYYTHG